MYWKLKAPQQNNNFNIFLHSQLSMKNKWANYISNALRAIDCMLVLNIKKRFY